MSALQSPPIPALLGSKPRIAPMIRIIIGALLMMIGIGLFIHCFSSHNYYYASLSIMLLFIGGSQLSEKSAETVAIPVLALLAAFVLFSVFMAFSGVNPFSVVSTMYQGAFGTDRRGNDSPLQNTLLRAAPLMLTGLCTALPMRLGMVIIGGEGALGMGALVAGGIGAAMLGHSSMGLMVLTMLVGGALAGGVWITIAGALKQYRGVNETISSLLLIYIGRAIFDTMIEGPWKDPDSTNKFCTKVLGDDNLLGNIPMHGLQKVHWGLVIGVLACVVSYILVNHTTFGFSARVIGGNLRAAKVAGMSVGKVVLTMCMAAGGAAGLAGAIEVAATQQSANASIFQDGYGYTGILVAFLARQNPLAIIPVSLLIGGILASQTLLQTSLKLPDATVLVLQGTIFLMILASESYYGRLKVFGSLFQPKGA